MAKKKETEKNSEILTTLQKVGWFRNISDKYQVGIPDNIGAYRGILFGIEFKAVDEIPADGLTPTKKDHRFSKTQVKELKSLEQKGGGIALGMIACGSTLFWFTPEYISEDGQVDCNRLLQEKKYIVKDKEKGWLYIAMVFEMLWAHKMGKMHNLAIMVHRKYFNSTVELVANKEIPKELKDKK